VLVLVAVLPGGARAEPRAPLSFTVLPVGAYKVGDSHVRMLVQIKNASDKPVSFGFAATATSPACPGAASRPCTPTCASTCAERPGDPGVAGGPEAVRPAREPSFSMC